MKKRLIGSSSPLTTCTPTSSEITGTPGITATIVRDRDHRRDHAHEDGRLVAPAADALLEAERLGDHVGGRDRQDRAGEQAGAEQADPEQQLGVLAGERLERLAASAAEPIVWMPCEYSVAPVAMMMKAAIRLAKIAPDDRLALLARELVLAHAALDHRRLQVELHVGRDRRAGGRDEQQQVGRVRLDVGHDERLADVAPVRVGEDRRDRVGEERDRQPDEDRARPSGRSRAR